MEFLGRVCQLWATPTAQKYLAIGFLGVIQQAFLSEKCSVKPAQGISSLHELKAQEHKLLPVFVSNLTISIA